jgi:ribosome-associated heat shock protein Hsp15
LTAIVPQSAAGPERAKTRLDQWLWFARLTKSRSLAARLCAAGAVRVNGVTATKPNQTLRVGDLVVVPQGRVERTVRVMALGVRRGPSTEARALYDEAASPTRLRDFAGNWVPLLGDDDPCAYDHISP